MVSQRVRYELATKQQLKFKYSSSEISWLKWFHLKSLSVVKKIHITHLLLESWSTVIASQFNEANTILIKHEIKTILKNGIPPTPLMTVSVHIVNRIYSDIINQYIQIFTHQSRGVYSGGENLLQYWKIYQCNTPY